MRRVIQAEQESQHPHGSTNPDSRLNPATKRLLVVESAPLPRNFYRGPRPGRRLVFLDDNEIGARRLAEVGTFR